MYDACIYDPTLDSDACIHDAHICDPGPGDVYMVHVNMMRYFSVTDGRTRRFQEQDGMPCTMATRTPIGANIISNNYDENLH